MRTGTSDYTEVFMDDNSQNGDVIKAFVWNEALTPLDVTAMADRDDINSCDIVLNGSISVGECTENGIADFAEVLPDGYSDYVITISKDGVVYGELDGESLWQCSESGEYIAWLYAKKDGALIPCAKTSFFVYPELTEDDTFFFPAEKSYYVHNGERKYYTRDGFVPLLNNGNIYLSNDIIRNISGIEIASNQAVYKSETIVADLSVIEQKDGVYSFNAIAARLGYSCEMQEDILVVTKASFADSKSCDAAFDYIISHSLDGSTQAWNGLYYPDNWGFYDWSTGTQGSNFGTESNDKTDGANSVYIGAVAKSGASYAAYTYDMKNTALNGYLYAVSFDVKYSDDSTGNIPFAALAFDSSAGFMGHLQGTAVEGKKGEWTRVTSYFTSESIDAYDGYSKVTLLVGARATEADTAGKLYLDNVSFREVSILGDATEAEIVCGEFAAWHKFGEKVTYSPKDDRLRGFDKITAAVYNSGNEKVYEQTVSMREFYEKGWEYEPEKCGYYETEFYGIGRDGTKSLIVNCYTEKTDESYTVYRLARRSFAVVSGEANPMSERPDFLLFSDSADNTDHLKLANMIGFSGVRIHGIAWGSTADTKGFEPTKGSFDWTNADNQINNAYNEGFNNIIANVFATPVWAVNNDESDAYNIVGWYYKNCYKADDNNDIASAYGAFTERYKDKINGIEVWNEPHYGKTAFWRDTPDNFIELAKTAYDAIKSKSPDMTVYSAGFNQASALFGELMRSENFRGAFDAISFHGRYEDDAAYRRVLDTYGMGDIKLINSEGYFYAYYEKNKPKDFTRSSMQMYMAYFDHLKNNVDMAGLFEITENTPDEKRAASGTGHTLGLFRDYPYYEPRHGAVTAYNLFKNLGKDISFKGEYDLGGGRKAVAIKSDGETQIYIWNANDEDFAVPESIENCMSPNSTITDFEGNQADLRNLKKLRVYRISNVSETELDKISTSDNTVLNADYIEPFYNCRNSYGDTIEEYTPQEGIFTEGRLFDKDDFSDLDESVFNTDGFVWNSVSGADCKISAEFAVSVADEGLYMIIKTLGDTKESYASSAENIPDYDGIRIGIDCYGRLRAEERSEFFVGKVKKDIFSAAAPTLYKYNAAELYEAQPDSWTPSKTVMDSKYVDISSDGNETVYKIYLPYEELYPFVYRANNKKDLRMSIAISDTDDGVKQGDLCFGAGLAEENARVWKYGLLREYGMSAGLDIYSENGKIYINGQNIQNSSLITIVLKKEDGSIVNLDQINHADVSYSKQFFVEPGIVYRIIITDNNRNQFSRLITGK